MNHRWLVGMLFLCFACSSPGSSTVDGSGADRAPAGTGGTPGGAAGSGGAGGAQAGSGGVSGVGGHGAGGNLGTGGAGGATTTGTGGATGAGGVTGIGGMVGTGGSRADAGVDGASSCPTSPPMGDPCGGPMTCTYGLATCCGVVHPLYTCTCTAGSFLCDMTAECNIVCPDAGRDSTSG